MATMKIKQITKKQKPTTPKQNNHFLQIPKIFHGLPSHNIFADMCNFKTW